jgi:hypothetical protein
MQDVILIAKKRAFPSLGRVRLNVAHLDGLGIRDGERADLENSAAKKIVTVTVIADKQVPEGQVRVSTEDLASLGLGDGDKVAVRRSVPFKREDLEGRNGCRDFGFKKRKKDRDGSAEADKTGFRRDKQSRLEDHKKSKKDD